jgi:hypothetical protein
MTSLTIEDVIELNDDLTFERMQQMPSELLELVRRELAIELRSLEKAGKHPARQGAIRSAMDLCSMFMCVERNQLVSYSVSTLSDLSVISQTLRQSLKRRPARPSRIPMLKSSFWSKPVVEAPNLTSTEDVLFSSMFKKSKQGVVRHK